MFAIDVELVGGPGCGTIVPEVSEDTDVLNFLYTRNIVKKGETEYTARYKVDDVNAKAYYIEG